MSTNQHTPSPSQRHKVEGPQKHFLAYIISILLTILAFAVVLYGGIDKSFLILFLIMMAIVQAVFQLFIWMHMKDKGHTLPIVGLCFGAFVVFTTVIAVVYWVWW